MTKHILLAEDEPNIAESLTFLLEKAGFSVTTKSDGRDALNATLADVPDLLILDVMLPEMDGYEILRHIRADHRATKLPVIMLTAKGQREDRETALEYGADLFITKPFSNSEVVEAVKRLVNENSD